jgi:tetratricopeptide (TPR) repeat protein
VYPDITDLRGFLALYKNPISDAGALTRLYTEKGDFKGLVAEWRALVAARPWCPMRILFLARALEAAGHHAEALTEYRRVRDLEHWSLRLPEKKPWQAAVKRAVVGFFTGLAVPDYSHAADAFSGEARIHEAAGEWDAAIRAHRASLARQPESSDSCEALHRLHTAKGDLKGLARYLEGLVVDAPNSGQAWFWLGLAREGLGDFSGAAQAFREVLAVSSGSLAAGTLDPLVRVLCAAAGAALAEGRIDDARGPLAEAESLSPDTPCVLLGRARLAELTGDTEASLTGYRAGVESSPEAYDAYAALDRMYAARGDLETLEELWTGMTSAHPERRHAWYFLGLARERKGLHGEAAQAYGEALRLAPAGQEAPPREAVDRALRRAKEERE